MLNIPSSNKPRVVIVGGGFGGINLVKSLRGKPFQVVLLDKNNYHTFQPLLYQVATGGLDPGSIAFPLRKLLGGEKNQFFRNCEVLKVHPEKNEVETSLGTIPYDYLVIATGTATSYYGMESFRENSLPMKTVSEALNIRSFILENFEKAIDTEDPKDKEALANFVMVGGGPTGVELAGAFAEIQKYILPKDYPELDFTKMKVYLFESGPRLLAGMSPVSSVRAKKYLEQLGVTVYLNYKVKEYDGTTIKYGEDKTVVARTVLWTAGVEGALLKGFPENNITKTKRMKVDGFNKVIGSNNIFAIGDIAAMETGKMPKGHPQLAPVAIQQGNLLAKNLVLMQQGKIGSLKLFKYFDKGVMATVGRNRAVAETWKFKLGGWIAWMAWLWVHLLFLIGFRNKVVVFLDWMWNYFTFDKALRLIIRPYKKNNTP